jgi:hypothetical protein
MRHHEGPAEASRPGLTRSVGMPNNHSVGSAWPTRETFQGFSVGVHMLSEQTASGAAATLLAPSSSALGLDPGAEDRWAAWLAHGAEHDRRIRRRFAVVTPVVAVVAALIAYLLLSH